MLYVNEVGKDSYFTTGHHSVSVFFVADFDVLFKFIILALEAAAHDKESDRNAGAGDTDEDELDHDDC